MSEGGAKDRFSKTGCLMKIEGHIWGFILQKCKPEGATLLEILYPKSGRSKYPD
jgi:hypothetical protein